MARRISKYTIDYRRVRKNYLQFIRRYSLKEEYTPLKIPSKINKRELTKLEKEYGKLKERESEKRKVNKEETRKKQQEEKIEEPNTSIYKSDNETTTEDIDIKQDVTFVSEPEDFDTDDSDFTPLRRQTISDEQTYRPSQSDLVINKILSEIENWTPAQNWSGYFKEQKERDKNTAERILNGAIAQEGLDTIATRIEANAEELHRKLDRILYGSDGRSGETIQSALTQFASIIWGRIPTITESMSFSDYEEDIEE